MVVQALFNIIFINIFIFLERNIRFFFLKFNFLIIFYSWFAPKKLDIGKII